MRGSKRTAGEDDRTTALGPSVTAKYILDMTEDLARMARGSNLDLLGYLLDMAALEASNSARRITETKRA